MQQAPPSSLSGLEYALLSVALTLAGGIGAILTWFINRRKVKPEITVIEATAEKTRAEARRLDGDTIHQAYERIDELWEIGEKQRTQIRELQMDNDKKAMEVEFVNEEIKWLTAVLGAAGVKLSDYDYLRKKRTEG